MLNLFSISMYFNVLHSEQIVNSKSLTNYYQVN